MNDTDFFLELLRKGKILKSEENDIGWIARFRLDDMQYVLSLTRCHDIKDAWEYTVTDTNNKVISEGWYTKYVNK